MGEKKDEKEVLYERSKESFQEITGWKVFIFLPLNISWRLFVVGTVVFEFVFVITRCVYNKVPSFYNFIDLLSDVTYAIDVLLATMHFAMRKTRKLKHGGKRHVVCLIIDYISLMPFEGVFNHYLYNNVQYDARLSYYLSLVGALRIYQFPKNFRDIKASTFNLKFFVTLLMIELVLYYVIFTHFLSCFIFLYFNEEQKRACLERFSYCVFENSLVTFFLLQQIFVPPFMNFPLENYTVWLIIVLFTGYILTFGYIIPSFIFGALKVLYRYFDYSKNQMILNILIKNSIGNKPLEQKVLDYFQIASKFGRGESQEKVLQIFPLGMKKNICCDIHWETFRHSILLQDLTMGCKRSLALYMSTEFVLPKTTLLEKGRDWCFFLYVESGSLHVMAEENGRSSVLNLTSGTVLGEISFFLHKKPAATVRAEKFSVIHVLKFRDFFRVIGDYPNDKLKVMRKVRARLTLAKSVSKIKSEVCYQIPVEKGNILEETKWGNIKWIKQQYRAVSNLKHAEAVMNLNRHNQYFVDDYQRQVHNLAAEIDHTSVFLRLISFNDQEVRRQEAVCVKSSFPWLMDSQCHFFVVWKTIIFIVTVFTIVLYPAFIGWSPHIPRWFYTVSIVVSSIFITDVILQFFTALRSKNFLITKTSLVFTHRIATVTLYFDILAAVPLQLFTFNNEVPFYSNLYFSNALVKSYILIAVLHKWNYKVNKRAFIRNLAKYLFFLMLLIYWCAAVFNLTGVECIFYSCNGNDWYDDLVLITNGTADPLYAGIFKAVCLGFNIPEYLTPTEVYPSFIIFWVLFTIIHFFRFIMKGGCTASYILDLSYDVEYKALIDFVYKFLTEHKLMGMIRKRVITTMQFSWNYERGNSIIRNGEIWNLLPQDLGREIDYHLKLPYLAKSKLFQWEEEDFLLDMCAKASRLVLPANFVLLTLGTQTRSLYIVLKGFVQVNSFVNGDLNLNTARPITAKQGDAFPVIDVLSQSPAAVTAVTASDCELLLLDLEDVLSVMMTHGMFKDVVESVQETNISLLTSARLAMSEYKDAFSYDDTSHKSIFSKIKCLGSIVNLLLKKKAIDSHSVTYVSWEFICVLHIMISLVTWPIMYSLFAKSENQHLYMWCLIVFDFLTVPDFYIRLHVAYYNKMGICITHTGFTALHYLGTAFAVDLIAFAPNLHSIFIITKNVEFKWLVVVCHTVMRSLSLYRFTGFLSYLNIKKRTIYQTQLVAVLSLFGLGLHYYLCFMVYLYVLDFNKPEFRLTVEKINLVHAHEYYLNELGLIIAMFLRSHCYFDKYHFYSISFYVSLSTLGLIATMLLYSHLTLKSTAENSYLTTYQHYMQSFVNYLYKQKAEDKVISRAVEHFEYEWTQLKGRNKQKIFSKFPQSLHEDVMLPLYKGTLSGVESLSKANEYFYRTLCRNIKEVFLKKDAVVIFQKEVQANIYFIHKGRCLIQESTQTLYKGAMIGDIKRNGLMKNTITAKTNLMLLKIPSNLFFLTLNNFYATKLAFMAETVNADDFVKSIYVELEDTYQENFPEEEEFLECEFVSEMNEQIERKVLKKKIKKWYMKMESKKAQFLRFCFMIIAYASVIIIPIFMAVRLVSPLMRVVVYGLDFLWIIKIILNSRIISDSSKKKNKRRRKGKKYTKRMFKLIVQIVSVSPIELIPLAHYGLPLTDQCCYVMSFCYVNRLLRIYFIFSYFEKKGKKLLVNFKMTVLEILILKIALLNICCCVNIGLNCEDVFQHFKCYHSISSTQLNTLLLSYLCVINKFINGAMALCVPSDFSSAIFHLFVTSWALISKAFFINNILMILYVANYNKSTHLVKLQQLQNYLTVRDVSPVLLQRTERYFSYLLNSYSEGAEPLFLKTAPAHLKMSIMQDLYMSNLESCYLFQNLDEIFLKQLATRLFLNVFFPGDYIAEKGDVDHNMYFIKEGEVYCIETDKNYTTLETATNMYVAGDYFGELQGILSCYPHSQTYRAKTLTNILVLNFNRWEDLRAAFPEAADQIFRKCIDSLNA